LKYFDEKNYFLGEIFIFLAEKIIKLAEIFL